MITPLIHSSHNLTLKEYKKKKSSYHKTDKNAYRDTHIDSSDCDLGGPIKLKPRVLYSLPEFCTVLWALLYISKISSPAENTFDWAFHKKKRTFNEIG